MARPHIVLVSREVWPFLPGGGIGRGVRDTALALASQADVTVITSRRYEPRFAAVAAEPGAWVATPGITFAWADEPEEDPAPFWSPAHAWSAACRDALAHVAAERPVDLAEFGDYGGAAAVTLQARRSGDPVLRDVPVAVRLHTTWEMSRALDEQPVDDLPGRVLAALERTSLALADVLLAPGPSTAAAYHAAYGAEALAPVREVPLAFALGPAPAEGAAPDGPLRVLYVGRLQHLKGADALVEAVRAQPGAELELTLVGGDTPTGPGGGSMREHLLALAAGDRRIAIGEPVPSEELPALIARHDLVVLPSRFEAFGYVLREANAENRPVLAAPVGGLRDGLVEGRGGWAAPGTDAADLGAALARLAADPGPVRAMRASGAPRAVAEEQAAGPVAGAYLELAAHPREPAAPAAPAGAPLWALVTATGRSEDLAATVAALRAQDDPELRIAVAADGPHQLPGDLLGELAALTYVPPGPRALGDARLAALDLVPAGAAVLLLRAGERPAPGFAARARGALAAEPRAAYATAWAAGRLTGRTPLGNGGGVLVGPGEASATVALLRPGALRAEDLADAPPGAEDAALFARLAARGAFGAVIPDPLVAAPHAREDAPSVSAPQLAAPDASWATAAP